MRMTAKFKAARQLAMERFPDRKQLLKADHDTLYEYLFDQGLTWDHRAGEWVAVSAEDRDFQGGYGSAFTTSEGNPTGIYHLRIMAHPDDLDSVVAALRACLTLQPGGSDRYPNRKGPGVRAYLVGKLDKV